MKVHFCLLAKLSVNLKRPIQSLLIATDNGALILERKRMIFRGTADSIDKHLRALCGSSVVIKGYLVSYLGTCLFGSQCHCKMQTVILILQDF